jgi:hypothetical protein
VLWRQVREWLRRNEGQDLSEYALAVFLVVIGAVAAVTLFGDTVSSVLDHGAVGVGAAAMP